MILFRYQRIEDITKLLVDSHHVVDVLCDALHPTEGLSDVKLLRAIFVQVAVNFLQQ